MNEQDAYKIAVRYLNDRVSFPTNGDSYSLILEGVEEDEDGWYFPYQTDKYISTRDLNFSVVGNWPIYVTKDGRVAVRRFGMPFETVDPQ
jgi:hypothetical protein